MVNKNHLQDSLVLLFWPLGIIFGFPCKFNLSHAIAVDHAQELTDKHWQLCLFENVEDSGVIDTEIRTSETGQENSEITCCACGMCHCGRFHLKDVLRHLSGRNTSLSRVDTPSGVFVQAKADRRGDVLAVTFTQGQRGVMHQVISQ